MSHPLVQLAIITSPVLPFSFNLHCLHLFIASHCTNTVYHSFLVAKLLCLCHLHLLTVVAAVPNFSLSLLGQLAATEVSGGC